MGSTPRAAWVVALVACARLAHADGKSKPESPPAPAPQAAVEAPPWAEGVPRETQARASALFEQANELFAREATTPAIDKYREALALWDHPLVRFNLAVTLIRADRVLEAADELERALRYGKLPFTPELYAQALDYAKLVTARVGALAVTCVTPGASVTLDGKPWFTCPATREVRMLSGEHTVVADKAGYLTLSRKLVVAGGGKKTSEQLDLVSIERAVVLRYRYPRWLPFAIAGGGLALAAAGTGFYLAGRSGIDDVDREIPQQCTAGCRSDFSDQPVLASQLHRAQLEGKVGIGLVAGGGVIALAGVVLAVINTKPLRELPSADIAPTRGGAAAVLGWRF